TLQGTLATLPANGILPVSLLGSGQVLGGLQAFVDDTDATTCGLASAPLAYSTDGPTRPPLAQRALTDGTARTRRPRTAARRPPAVSPSTSVASGDATHPLVKVPTAQQSANDGKVLVFELDVTDRAGNTAVWTANTLFDAQPPSVSVPLGPALDVVHKAVTLS